MFGNISLRDFIFQWNLRFKYDRRFRKKYNIPFGSEQHLNTNQIDIYLDFLEDREFEKLENEFYQTEKDKEDPEKQNSFLKERQLSKEEDDKLFEKLRKNFKNGG